MSGDPDRIRGIKTDFAVPATALPRSAQPFGRHMHRRITLIGSKQVKTIRRARRSEASLRTIAALHGLSHETNRLVTRE